MSAPARPTGTTPPPPAPPAGPGAPSPGVTGGAGAVSGAAGGPRLVSLDAFRGATIMAMILVNNPGTWSAIYPPFRHAPWHGWTPTDLIFPFFLFIVGVAVPFALGRRLERGRGKGELLGKAAKRAAVLFLLGLGMAAWPFLDFAGGGVVLRDFSTLRIPGVLQRIAVCYLAVSALYLWVRPRWQVALSAAVLQGYWAALAWIPVPGGEAGAIDVPSETLAAWVDRALLGDHLWVQADRMWDPEGVLSTLPAVVTTLLGVWTGMALRDPGRSPRGRVRVMWMWGVALTVAGLSWDVLFPINKQLWTSSYVLFSGGMALLCLAGCYWLADVRGRRGWTRPFVIYGVNALTVFVASGVLARTLNVVRVGSGEERTSLAAWIYRGVFQPLGPAELTSLLHALAWVGGWYLVLRWMWRRGIVWKV